MRIFLLALTGMFVLLPALLILFAPGRAIGVRIVWAVAAVLGPLVTFGLTHMIPMLSNNSAEATQWERFAGLLLSGSGFFLPWVLFALFVHFKPR